MVGAWCFVDHFGPEDVTTGPGMQIAPHPHTGLQTVSWLVEGEILHRDSVGSIQPIAPGQLNLMTAGHGIAHSEQSPPVHPPAMHGIQLWIALPEDARHGPPRFEHHPVVPAIRDGGAAITVVVGSLGGVTSPARVHTPILGAEIVLAGGAPLRLPLERPFEYAVMAMTGSATVAGVPLAAGSLLYLGTDRTELTIESDRPVRLFLFGGEPFADPLVMWWNFVARDHDEIVAARDDWMSGRRFGQVAGDADDPLPAPAMPTVRLKARYRTGTYA
jgi:redox-sensitive bicupin YhaK (pirin superfamily)